MSRLNDLLRQLEAKDPSLAKDLAREYDALADRRAFGLNFERHTPEAVELPGRKVRRGDKVHVLPERGMNPDEGERPPLARGRDRPHHRRRHHRGPDPSSRSRPSSSR